jgi:malonyl CoA-acyl carrier protein transacylase
MRALMFPGQGIQRAGMGCELFLKYKDIVEIADNILGYSLVEICKNNPDNKLDDTLYSQPVIFTVNHLSYLNYIEEAGQKPDFILGHSLGEYNALVAAGAIGFEEGLSIVKKRAELTSQVKNGGMAAVLGMDYRQIEAVLKKYNYYSLVNGANINTEYQTVLAGMKEHLNLLEKIFVSEGARFIHLKVSVPFHSKYMEQAKKEFEPFIKDVSFSDLSIPVISNVTALPYQKGSIGEMLCRHLVLPVKWYDSVSYLLDQGTQEFIEINNENKVLTRLVDSIKADRARNNINVLNKDNGMELIPEIVLKRAEKHGDRIAFRFLNFLENNEASENILTFKSLANRSAGIAGFLKDAGARNERVILLFNPGIEYIISFYGCLLAKAIAVPAYPPLNRKLFPVLQDIINDSQSRFALTTRDIYEKIQKDVQKYPELSSLKWVIYDNIDPADSEKYSLPDIKQEDIAYLQYTSGSTSKPKGVMITHGNIIANSGFIKEKFEHTTETKLLMWTPPFHDMGLVGGILHPVHVGIETTLMSPVQVFQQPVRWLSSISKYRINTSAGPSFSYDLCVRKITQEQKQQLDLSSWTCACNGAEPVSAETMDEFTKYFESCGFKPQTFFPCYGLAESVLFVSSGKKDEIPKRVIVDKSRLSSNKVLIREELTPESQVLVSNGCAPSGEEIQIVNPETKEICKENEIGEIWIKSASVGKGYWGKEEISRQQFMAATSCGKSPFLRTGDLGFINDNELYITGRIKDLIIIRGRNYYPHDIEKAVNESHEYLNGLRCAAFSIDKNNLEKLVIIIEVRRKPQELGAEICSAIVRKISENFNIGVHFIGFTAIGTIPVTTSGKLQRGKSRLNYLKNEFNFLYSFSEDDIQHQDQGEERINEFDDVIAKMPPEKRKIFDFLKERFAVKLGIDKSNISPGTEFGKYGLESIHAIELAGEIEEWVGYSFSPTVIYNNPTLLQLTDTIYEENTSKNRLIEELSGTEEKVEDDIAVIGIGGVFPGCNDVNDLWKHLINGENLITEIPEHRWDWRKFQNNAFEGSNYNACSWGGFCEDFRYFDFGFFGISREEAEAMDPQQKKLLEVVWNTFYDAGYSPLHYRGKQVGVFMGVSSTDFADLIKHRKDSFNSYSATGASLSLLPNRISYFYDFHGPSEAIDTACSSSLISIHRAVKALKNGECTLAVAGGANIMLIPEKFKSLKLAGVLSNDGQCKTFDKDANGYVRAEGVGTVLLKPLKKAITDGDPIYAVIKGAAESHGGSTNSLTSPNETVQTALLVKAYRSSGIDPQTVSYIEAHGTGTALGDPIEVDALKKAFSILKAEAGTRITRPFCGIGSVKTNIGHLEAAAGIAGFIKIVLMLYHKKMAPSINLNSLNPYIRLENSPFYIVREYKEWESGSTPRRAGISSFGFGGSYAHVILEEYSRHDMESTDTNEKKLFVFSAKNKTSLKEYLKVFYEFIQNTCYSLGDIAYTLQNGREAFDCRIAVIASNKGELTGILDKYLSGEQMIQGFYESGTDLQKTYEIPDTMNQFEKAAISWVLTGKADFEVLKGGKAARCAGLPGYRFEKHEFDLSYKLLSEPVTDSSKVGIMGAGAGEITYETLSSFLSNIVASLAKVDFNEVDHTKSFYDYGLNSIDIINIHSKLTGFTGRSLPQDSFYKYPTIKSLCECILDINNAVREDLWNDAVLDEDIVPPANALDSSGRVEKILLTGATGYVGSFLLCELLKSTNATVYCLARGKNRQEVLDRIHHNFITYKIEKGFIQNRIEIVLGDLSKKHLGLSADNFRKLGGTIDVIYHGGGAVDWVKPYINLKSDNVDGTREIIRLAFTGRLKPLHFISSLAVVPLSKENFYWKEEPIADYRGIFTGYGQSKWVAEQLCFEAQRRGLPVSVYRFDFAVGTSETGIMKESDFIIRMIKGSIKLKCIPDIEVYFDFVPVDYLARIILTLSSDRGNLGKIYHIFNKDPFPSTGFADLFNTFNYKVHKVPYDIWKDLILLKQDNSLHPTYPFLLNYDNDGIAMYRRWIVDNYRTSGYLEKNAPELINDMPDSRSLLRKVMEYLAGNNIIPAANCANRYNQQLCYWDNPESSSGMLTGNAVSTDVEKASVVFDKDTAEKLKSISEKYSTNMMELLLGITYIMNSRYNLGAESFIGIPGKAGSESGSIHVVNFEVNVDDNPVFPLVLYRTQSKLKQICHESSLNKEVGAYNKEYIPDIRHHVLFSFNDETDSLPHNGFYSSSFEDFKMLAEKADLAYYFTVKESNICCDIYYNTNVIGSTVIESMVKHLNSVIMDIAQEPHHDIFRYQLWVGCDFIDQGTYE